MSTVVLETLISGRNYGFNGGSWSSGCLWKSPLYVSVRAPRRWRCISVVIADTYNGSDFVWKVWGTNDCAAEGFGELAECFWALQRTGTLVVMHTSVERNVLTTEVWWFAVIMRARWITYFFAEEQVRIRLLWKQETFLGLCLRILGIFSLLFFFLILWRKAEAAQIKPVLTDHCTVSNRSLSEENALLWKISKDALKKKQLHAYDNPW